MIKLLSNLLPKTTMYFIDPIIGGALVAGGASLLGGLFSGFGAAAEAKEERKSRLEELEESRRQFGVSLEEKAKDRAQSQQQFDRSAGFSGIKQLGANVDNSRKRALTYRFKNDFINALSSGGK